MNAIDKIDTDTAHPVDLDEAMRTAALKAERDPGRKAEEIATDRIVALVEELQRGSIANLTEQRDKTDDLMRALKEEGAQAIAYFMAHAAHVQQAVEMKGIVTPQIDGLLNSVSAPLSPAPGRTLTQRA